MRNIRISLMLVVIIFILIFLSGCRSNTHPEILNPFLEVNSMPYSYKFIDYWRTPEETARDRVGDCKDKAFYLFTLYKNKGIKSQIIFGLYDENYYQLHCWIELYIDGVKYILDPTNNYIGTRTAATKREMFIPIITDVFLKDLRTYIKKTGISDFNPTYDILVWSDDFDDIILINSSFYGPHL